MEGEVLEIIYMGDILRTRLRLGGTDSFIVKIPNSPDHCRLNPGERVQVSWKVQDARALEAA